MKIIKLYKQLLLGAVFCLFTADIVLAESYAEDRAEIENLMYKYIFALDLKEVDSYVETFTQDAILNHAGGFENGRSEIRKFIQGSADKAKKQWESRDKSLPRPIPNRHNIGNLELEVNGDTAKGRAYWTSVRVDENRQAQVWEYGFYEDEYRRVNGKWLFSNRIIVNEFRDGRQFGVVESGY